CGWSPRPPGSGGAAGPGPGARSSGQYWPGAADPTTTSAGSVRSVTEPQPEDDGEFESVLVYLKESRGFDFTGYKRSSLRRRVQRRMTQAGAGSYAEYIDQLQVNADEFVALFNTILINVN